MFLLLDFGEVLCSSANELQQNSNTSSREDYIPHIYLPLIGHKQNFRIFFIDDNNNNKIHAGSGSTMKHDEKYVAMEMILRWQIKWFVVIHQFCYFYKCYYYYYDQ